MTDIEAKAREIADKYEPYHSDGNAVAYSDILETFRAYGDERHNAAAAKADEARLAREEQYRINTVASFERIRVEAHNAAVEAAAEKINNISLFNADRPVLAAMIRVRTA